MSDIEEITTILIASDMIQPQDQPQDQTKKRGRGRPRGVHPSASTQYQREWKEKNREKWNEYQKAKIQKKREDAKISKYLQYIAEKLKK